MTGVQTCALPIWGHAVGYPLEDASAGGQRVRLKFESLFNNERMGNPRKMADGLEEALREKGLIQEQAPIPGRFEEIDKLSQEVRQLEERLDD